MVMLPGPLVSFTHAEQLILITVAWGLEGIRGVSFRVKGVPEGWKSVSCACIAGSDVEQGSEWGCPLRSM